jgi:NAD dependent epimerase/dehydratase family enzyme
MLGKERAATLIGGNRVANKRIIEDGFMFRYKTLDEALHDLFLYKK